MDAWLACSHMSPSPETAWCLGARTTPSRVGDTGRAQGAGSPSVARAAFMEDSSIFGGSYFGRGGKELFFSMRQGGNGGPVR